MLPVKIVQALERGAIIVTGNQRAARTLQIAFDRRNRAQGLDFWAPPAILAWDSWTMSLWHQLLTQGHVDKMLLNQTQEHTIWREILTSDTEVHSLRTVDSLGEMAAEAWSLLCDYNGRHRIRLAGVSADTRAFRRWALKFEQRCEAERLLARVQLEESLQHSVEAGEIRFPEAGVVLVGFDSITPSRLALIEKLRETAVAIEEQQLFIASDQRTLVAAADESEELRTAAKWVRSVVEHNPAARVAVVVPHLDKQRAEIDRIFREVLAPELEDIAAADDFGPFEFSIGRMLADTPMIATALNLLRWSGEALPLQQVSQLLLSPYFASVNIECGMRAEFDAFELRRTKMLRPEVSLGDFIAVLEKSKRRPKLTGLLARLRALKAAPARQPSANGRRLHSEWAESMRELLAAAGWGKPNEDSIEFQTRRKWESALDELSTLDFSGGRVEFAQALEALQRIAQQTMFAPESREAPVQVMGPLESAGSTFDAIWFLRSGDLNWPTPRNLNPLLPWSLQHDLGMPGTNAARDSDAAQRMTARIAESAKEVVFSYAVESAEGRQRPSAVLNELNLEPVAIEEVAPADDDRTPIVLETVEDAAQLQPIPDKTVHGGAEILRLQAACGFRAFAERRLWSTEIRSKETGLDAAERGTLVHLVLEKFWNQVKTQRELKLMPLHAREAMLNQCISSALEKIAKLSKTPWDAAYLDMQHERLRNLLGPWLELELKRPPFEVKLSEKELKDVRVGPLQLSVRVDRIDIGQEGEIIIDYKTGPAKPGDWLSERPDQPQLPLYAVLSDAAQLEGVAFGHIRAGKDMGLQGFAVSEITGIRMPRQRPVSLEAQIDEWRRVLTSLAEDFYNGDARVRPKDFPSTCTYCAQRLLCRVDPAAFENENNEAAEGERE